MNPLRAMNSAGLGSEGLHQRGLGLRGRPVFAESSLRNSVHEDLAVDLVARVLREFYGHRKWIEPEGLDTGTEERFAEASALLCGPATTDVAAQYGGGCDRLPGSTVPNAALAQFTKGYVDKVGGGLHDFGIMAA